MNDKYLVNKVLKEAQVLELFFEKVISDNSLKPTDIMWELYNQYSLTQETTQSFDDIALKISKAKEMIDVLKKQFEVNKNGNIKHKKELFESIYHDREEPPKGNFSVTPFTFAMCFYLSGNQFDNSLGFTDGLNYRMHNLLDGNLEESKKKHPKYRSLSALAFNINRDDNHPATPKEILLSRIFNENIRMLNTEKHELKHIIDKFIREDYLILSETSANLFEGNVDYSSDLERSLDLIKHRKSKKSEIINYPKFIQDQLLPNHEKLIKESEEYMRYLKKFPFYIFNRLKEKGASLRLQSYIIPLVKREELPSILEKINVCLAK